MDSNVYVQQFQFLLANNNGRFSLNWEDRYPILNEDTSQTSFDAHYVYHPAWAARILAETKPAEHVDISGSLNFCTIVSAFIPVKFYDYRPAPFHLSGLTSGRCDLMSLSFKDNSIESISCMHVIEHIGLGRYGDLLDLDGDLKAIKELKRVVKPGGNLLFVVPVGGKAKIMFNAHRIYQYHQVMEYFNDMSLMNYALCTDQGLFLNPGNESETNNQNYGMGCWWFKKTSD